MIWLTIRRGTLKGAFTKFVTYVKIESMDPDQLTLRKEKLENVWNEFDQVQTVIEESENTNSERNGAYREEFEDLYFRAMAEGKKNHISTKKS